MNIGTLSDIIESEKEIMAALEFAREEQSLSHAVGGLKRLIEVAGPGCTNAGKLLSEDRIKKLLRGLGRLNRAVRQLKETEVTIQ